MPNLKLSRLINTLFKYESANMLTHVEPILSSVVELATDPDQNLRQWAICFFCDFIEFTGSCSFYFADQYFIHCIINALGDTPNVRQPACYAVGLFAAYGGEEYKNVCIDTIPELFAVIDAEGARDNDNVYATENAISAIGKILAAFRGGFDSAEIIGRWIGTLPVVADESEAGSVYGLLLKLIGEGVEVGDARLMEVLCWGLWSEAVQGGVGLKMVCALWSVGRRIRTEEREKVEDGFEEGMGTWLRMRGWIE